jgi:hypothetical protein
MPYIKQDWEDEELADEALYNIKQSDDTPINENVKIELATDVIVDGTGLIADRMNYIEDGIETAQKAGETLLLSEYKNVETLAADRQLLDADTPIQRYDCGDANRNVFAPEPDAIENHAFFLVNGSDGGEVITVRDYGDTETIGEIAEGDGLLLLPDGNGGYKSAGGGGGAVESVVAGVGIAVDNTDPANPIIRSTVPTLKQRLVITSSTTFDTDDYPGLYAIDVQLAGAGGGSGGAVGDASGAACSGPGGGGEVRKRLLLASDITAPVSITIGAGGTAGAAGLNAGGNGGDTSFGSFFTATGGEGGAAGANVTSFPASGNDGGIGGSNGTGTADYSIPGSDGVNGLRLSATSVVSSLGGGNLLAPFTKLSGGSGTDQNGDAGRGYGGGAAGARSSSNATNRSGAAGANGVCIIDIYQEL